MAKKPDFRKSTAAMFLTMKDEPEEVQTGSENENANAVTEIPISEIDDFPDHPFHGYQSFAEGEVDAVTAHEIGVKLAEELWPDFEVIVATHCHAQRVYRENPCA